MRLLAILLTLTPMTVEAQEVIIYTYDALGRLVVIKKTGGPNDHVEVDITLDKAGNRKNYKVTGASASYAVVPLGGYKFIPLHAS